MYKVCVKYGLDVHVKDILNGKIISNAAWKGLVNSAIMERENTMWSISTCLYSSLRMYRRVIPMIGLYQWWQLADSKPHLRQYCQSVVQIITEVVCTTIGTLTLCLIRLIKSIRCA